ncbi:hypothetical protein IB269_16425 [Delftia sp. DLF01]|uniref:hypothetical protein n=1 Tax=Delftia sp. DLF01 TaxID=2769279 RepID=UPI00177A9E31|nr:hypothetical protein [Delftia sp. DLF01]MBD9582979.1 hypothetical protein [Delftia sp. DLF01]
MGKSISMDASEDDWQAKSDMRTLAEAEEIRKDSKRFKAAMEKAREKLAEIESLLDSDKK